MSIQSQGQSLTLAQGYSDMKIKICFSQKPPIHMQPNFMGKLKGTRKLKLISISYTTEY